MQQGGSHTHVWPLPRGRLWDRLFAYAKFVKNNGRLPGNAMRFNDVLYRQKIASNFPSPQQVLTADKELAKQYVADRVGMDHTVPTLAVLRTPEEVRAFDYPDVCVVKATHSSGKFYIRHQGDPIDPEMIASWLADDFYLRSREPQYRPLERKIIVEPLVFGREDPEDFRFFCFEGQVRAILHEPNRSLDLARFYTPDWQPLECSLGMPVLDTKRPAPACLPDLLRDVETLARDFYFVRIDVFCRDTEYLFGELTHVHGNAAEQFFPPEAEAEMSRLMFADTRHDARIRGAYGRPSEGPRSEWPKSEWPKSEGTTRHGSPRISIKKRIRQVLFRLLPASNFGDWLAGTLKFVWTQSRLPREQMIFNDVLYRLKTDGSLRDALRKRTTDKVDTKAYIAQLVGERHVVPTLAVLNTADEIHSFDFPHSCAIKPAHSSQQVILRLGSEEIDRDEIARWLDEDYYRISREANYLGLPRRIIVEPLVFDQTEPTDYKIFCFRGEPRMIQCDLDRRTRHTRHTRHTRQLFDTAWRRQPYSLNYTGNATDHPRPGNLDALLEIAGKLAMPFEFVRIDLYTDGQAILVGEITHCHGSASETFIPRSAEQDASRLLFGARTP